MPWPGGKAGRLHHAADRVRDVVEQVHRLPADLGHLLDRLRGELRRRGVEEDIGAGSLQVDDLRVDGRIGRFVGQFRDDRHLAGESVLETLHVVLTVVVVLVEDRDLALRVVLQQVLGVDAALALVVRLPAHGPGIALRIVPLGRTGRDEELRHLLGVHVFLDSRVPRRAERLEHQQHFVALDQLARLLDGLRRRIAVVIGDVVDLAAVDAALGVHLVEVGADGLADRPVGRGRPAIRVDVADLDLGVGRAGVVLLLRERRCSRPRRPNPPSKPAACVCSSAFLPPSLQPPSRRCVEP